MSTRRSVLPLIFLATSLSAQVRVRTDSAGHPYEVAPLVVTATRSPTALSRVPQAVSVLDSTTLRTRPNATAVALLAELPGVDLTGVGPNQQRPVIRGARGQRILLLEDGLRMNNSRRQQDFGELPALTSTDALDRVEIVRGPSSVLYGSDAIGGVMNLVGASLPWTGAHNALNGALRYTYGGNGAETRPSATLTGRTGRLSFRVDGTIRTADPYQAPAGDFGDVHLAKATRVQDTGLEDRDLSATFGLHLNDRHRLFVKGNSYAADDAGFGYVDPAELGGGTKVQILYPRQRVTRGTLGYLGRNLALPFVDRLDVALYAQGNERDLHQNITVPFGPGAQGVFQTRNFTDVGTVGGRIEAAKLVGTRLVMTYGADLFRDRTVNTDHDTTTITGFGPPMVMVDSAPNLPNASYRALGLFAQGAVTVTERLNITLGARYQDNRAETRVTPNLPDAPVASTDRAVAGAFNALYTLNDAVTLIATVGRGFRSPNLVERFFDGVTPEGSGYQSRNPDLTPETSLSTDLGVRLRKGAGSFEAFAFRNAISDGIRVVATGDTVAGFPEYQNVNIDRLNSWGIEANGQTPLGGPFTALASYTWYHEENAEEPLTPVGQSFASKITGALRYDHPAGHVWSQARVRHQGRTDQVALGTSPVGAEYPGFTTVAIDAGLRLFDADRIRHTIALSVENLGNALYAETGNAGFFRPAPGRRVQLGWTTEF